MEGSDFLSSAVSSEASLPSNATSNSVALSRGHQSRPNASQLCSDIPLRMSRLEEVRASVSSSVLIFQVSGEDFQWLENKEFLHIHYS